jgi:hypothetical protein
MDSERNVTLMSIVLLSMFSGFNAVTSLARSPAE